ncbi:pentatricopeptide repeat-containing protein CRR2, chloroplastic-like [Tasmannia lanceolata]|uniref:pentatricopeptide repeat-containing protein CRR2, chloroplastic-like n=1 Tax=Tasmannia lanceolata TaxID=3420 RepID=UPI0040638E53
MCELSLALSRCLSPSFASFAQSLHAHTLKLGNLSNLHLATRLIVAYSKCGSIKYALQLFDDMTLYPSSLDTISWNAIIAGCIQNARDKDAFQYFKKMQFHDYCNNGFFGPDSYTISSLLSSTHCLENQVTIGEQLHVYATKAGILSNLSVGNALITLYAVWGRVQESRLVFESMTWQNVVTWTALISGHARWPGHEEECLRLFLIMMREDGGERPNQFTLALMFSLCGRLAWLSQGTYLMALALKIGQFSDIHVQNSLVGFYSECGCLEDAMAVFNAIIKPDIVSWNSLLKGYSQQGRGKEALKVFKEMHLRGTKPDSISFLSVLSACSHSGMTSEGLGLFWSMERDHGIEPGMEHVSCLVNLLGRAGQLREAEEFIDGIRFELGPSVWKTLLGACRVHGNEELAELAVAQLLKVEPRNSEAHVVLTHIYAASGRWDMVGNLRRSMKEKGVEKEPGFSWIEVSNKVHSFVAADRNHPQMDLIMKRLIELTNIIKDETMLH